MVELENGVSVMISKVSLLKKEGHMLEKVDHVVYITLEKFVGSKERDSCKTAIPEVWVSQDVSAI